MSPLPPPDGMLVRASQILRIRKIWLLPVTIAAVFVALMSVTTSARWSIRPATCTGCR